MRVVIISKRKMKKALSRNVEQHGMSRVLLLELSGKCGFVKKAVSLIIHRKLSSRVGVVRGGCLSTSLVK